MTMSAPAQLEEQIEGMIEKLLNFQKEVQNNLAEIQNLEESDQYARHQKESNRYGRQQKECLNFDSNCLTLKEYKDKYELNTLLFLKEEEKKLEVSLK